MKAKQLFSIPLYISLSCLLLVTGCATAPVLKLPENLPSIVKELKHVTVHAHKPKWVNTGISLKKVGPALCLHNQKSLLQRKNQGRKDGKNGECGIGEN